MEKSTNCCRNPPAASFLPKSFLCIRYRMEAVIEAIAEHIESALNNNKPFIAKHILLDIEEWYADHLKQFEKAKDLFDDPVFIAVYYYGYDELNWYSITSTLEVEYYNRIHDMIYERPEEPEDANVSEEDEEEEQEDE